MPTSEACDVVVIGSGLAGLACAVAAAELGLSCLVLEKAEKLGGGSAISGGSLWVGANHLNAAAGGRDSQAEVIDYLRYVGAGGLDAARMQTFVEEAPPALQFFEACGIPFQLTTRIDHYHGVAPGAKTGGRILDTPPIAGADLGDYQDRILLPAGRLFRHGGNQLQRLGGANSQAAWDEALLSEHEQQDMRGGGTGLVGWFVRLAAARGVAIRTATAVDRLTTDTGRVTGVITRSGEHIGARRGVVIACGGYESNPDLVASYESLPGFQSMFPDSITGDGLVMATEIGAAMRVIGNNLSVFMGFRNPDDAPSGDGSSGGTALCRLSSNQELPSKHTIVVNRTGRRFTDETFFQAAAPSLRVFDVDTREQPNLPCFLIFDAQYGRTESFAGRRPGAPIPSWVTSGASLAEVAAVLGIDPAGLQATAERFNADARLGIDSEFHRGEVARGLTTFAPGATLGTIEQPPFYGIELHPTSLASAGVVADPRARVMHVRGMPIPGLYAIGNAAARTETGAGYQTGFSLASAMTFGLLAARDMAGTNQGGAGQGGAGQGGAGQGNTGPGNTGPGNTGQPSAGQREAGQQEAGRAGAGQERSVPESADRESADRQSADRQRTDRESVARERADRERAA
jgi:3-oxosteroid 1-dehydrogenase